MISQQFSQNRLTSDQTRFSSKIFLIIFPEKINEKSQENKYKVKINFDLFFLEQDKKKLHEHKTSKKIIQNMYKKHNLLLCMFQVRYSAGLLSSKANRESYKKI